MKPAIRKWIWRGLAGLGAAAFLLLFVGLPLAGSFLITNARFSFPDPAPADPSELGLEVEPVGFASDDGLELHGWWNPGNGASAIIVFVHGLNRSRIELLERAVRSHDEGYGTLLFDLRNHGDSPDAYTTLGVDESRDVCAAEAFVRRRAPVRPIAVWGVSLGAATALLSTNRCADASAMIADSSFLSFEETVSHHFELIFPLPSFPIADLIIELTRRRMGFALEDGDVERAVAGHPALPVLFIAGGDDVRMPPELARRLYAASANPLSDLLLIDGAAHGRAYETDPVRYLAAVFRFLDAVAATNPN